MRTIEARLSCGSLTTARLHGPHRASVIAIALFVFSGTLQASGQGITVTTAFTVKGGGHKNGPNGQDLITLPNHDHPRHHKFSDRP